MPALDALKVSASAMSATRAWMDVVSENLANADVTRAEAGGPYRRKVVVFSQVEEGVAVRDVEEDTAPPRMVHDPGHPDADAGGYVQYPNVNPIHEMVDMMAATRAYEANVAAFNATKAMVSKALEIGRG